MDKQVRILLLFFCFVLGFNSSAFSQNESTLKKYKSRTLADIIALNREGTDQILKTAKLEDKHGFIGIDPFYSRVKIIYSGTPRPISPIHKGLIEMWSKLQHFDKKFTGPYENEYLFKEGDVEYWIPVPKPVDKTMDEKLKSGDVITLFVIYVGAEKEKNVKDFESLFLSTAYEK